MGCAYFTSPATAPNPDDIETLVLQSDATRNRILGALCLAIAMGLAYIAHDLGQSAPYFLAAPTLVTGLAIYFQRTLVAIETVSGHGVLAMGTLRRWLRWNLGAQRFPVEDKSTLTIRRKVTGYESRISFYDVILRSGDTLLTCLTLAGAQRICRLISENSATEFLEDR